MNPPQTGASDALLDAMQYEADPLADRTMSAILHPAGEAAPRPLAAEHRDAWQRIGIVNQQIAQWTDNASVADWAPHGSGVPDDVAQALRRYLDAASALPDWADRAKIRRAEDLFMQQGVLSCTLLFCASLPECYMVPSLAEVLQTTGQLEQHTEYRIRATGAMIFPVMMRGGLTDPSGAGVAQVLKVRLIHATIRHLILRGSPEDALASLAGARRVRGLGVVPPLMRARAGMSMHEALFSHGWKLGEDGLPCNQEELAYTLLTFGYVPLRGMRTLGVGLSRADEEATLHAWNVMGHFVGVRRELMAETMDEAEALFERIQARGRRHPVEPDCRPELAGALMQTMASVIPWRLARPFPVLLTRRLCGRAASRELGLDGRVSWLSKLLFALAMTLVRGIDALVRVFLAEFSLARLVTRVVGYRFLTQMLMDQTRPLKLPDPVLTRVDMVMSSWGDDPAAPRWMNALEDRFTTPGAWQPAARR